MTTKLFDDFKPQVKTNFYTFIITYDGTFSEDLEVFEKLTYSCYNSADVFHRQYWVVSYKMLADIIELCLHYGC